MDFVILQVNGVDVSKSSHEEAIGVFQSASEPILVQMLRRVPVKPSELSSVKENAASSSLTCIAQRTCCLHENESFNSDRSNAQVQTELAGVDLPIWSAIDFYHQAEALGEVEDGIDEEQEMEYEEIKLKRVSSMDKLGLTLCDGLSVSRSNYNEDGKLTAVTDRINLTDDKIPRSKLQLQTSEKTTEFEEDEACVDENYLESEDKEVYIQSVAEGSLAAADGRLFQGDILLQINGIDVQNRYQAENLFAAATGPEITLLVSRPHNQADPLDVLSVAFPYPELEDEFQEDAETDEDVQVNVEEDMREEGNKIGKEKGENENEQLQENHGHEIEWRQDSGFGTSSLPRSYSDHDPNEGSNERTTRSRMSDESTPNQTKEETQSYAFKATESSVNKTISNMATDKRLNEKMKSMELECVTTSAHYPRRPIRQTRKQEKSDSDHIYETISDCLDHEPVYSTPYEVSFEAINTKPSSSHSSNPRTFRGVAEKPGIKDASLCTETILVKTSFQPLCKNHYKRGMPRSDRVEKANDVEQWIRKATAVFPSQQLYSQFNSTYEHKKHVDWRGTTSTKFSSSSGDSSGRIEKKHATVIPKRITNEEEMKKSISRDRQRQNYFSHPREDRDTSSAYNTGTGESWRSAHLSQTLQLPFERAAIQNDRCMCFENPSVTEQTNNSGWMQSTLSLSISVSGDHLDPVSGSLVPTNKTEQSYFDSTAETCIGLPCESCRQDLQKNTNEPQRTKRQPVQHGETGKKKFPNRPKDSGNNRLTRNDMLEKNCNYVTMLPATRTMYTNAENLQQTIWLQQQLFQQQLIQKQQAQLAGKRNIQLMSTIEEDAVQTGSLDKLLFSQYSQERHNRKPNEVFLSEQLHSDERKYLETNTEWRMKKRADGTRYITRRPTRDRLLRDRAHQISEERAGTTTDDDTLSELKLGRYWSKEERKLHVEKARERRQRQEELIRSKIPPLIDNSTSDNQLCPIEHITQPIQTRSANKTNVTNKTSRTKLTTESSKHIPTGLLTVTTV